MNQTFWLHDVPWLFSSYICLCFIMFLWFPFLLRYVFFGPCLTDVTLWLEHIRSNFLPLQKMRVCLLPRWKNLIFIMTAPVRLQFKSNWHLYWASHVFQVSGCKGIPLPLICCVEMPQECLVFRPDPTVVGPVLGLCLEHSLAWVCRSRGFTSKCFLSFLLLLFLRGTVRGLLILVFGLLSNVCHMKRFIL